MYQVFALLLVCVVLGGCSLAILNKARTRLEIVPVNVTSIKTAEGEVVGFLIAYLLPLATVASEQVNSLVVCFVLALFLLIVWSTNSYHVNPMLVIFGYHFYEVTSLENVTFLLVTKKDLRNARAIQFVVQLTNYMLLDVGGEQSVHE